MKKELEQKLMSTAFVTGIASFGTLCAGMAIDKYILNYHGDAGPASKLALGIGGGLGITALTSVMAVYFSALYETDFGLKSEEK